MTGVDGMTGCSVGRGLYLSPFVHLPSRVLFDKGTNKDMIPPLPHYIKFLKNKQCIH